MPRPKKPGKRAELDAWLERNRPRPIGPAEFDTLRRDLAPVSESYLRKLLRESNVPLAPLVEGVRQGNFEELESSLLAMLDSYEKARDQDGAYERAAIRRLVIAAREHARWAARDPEKRSEKEEMMLWMLTWLENPPVFREWVKLRRAETEKALDAPSNAPSQ